MTQGHRLLLSQTLHWRATCWTACCAFPADRWHALLQVSKDLGAQPHDAAAADNWATDAAKLAREFVVKHGMDVGRCEILLHVRPVEGLIRQLDGTVEKRFSKKELLYPIQVSISKDFKRHRFLVGGGGISGLVDVIGCCGCVCRAISWCVQGMHLSLCTYAPHVVCDALPTFEAQHCRLPTHAHCARQIAKRAPQSSAWSFV